MRTHMVLLVLALVLAIGIQSTSAWFSQSRPSVANLLDIDNNPEGQQASFSFGITRNFNRVRGDNNLLDVLAADKRFSKMVELINDDEEVRNALTDPGANYTVFAPVNEAFERVLEFFDEAPSKDLIRSMLFYHISNENIPGREIAHVRVISTALMPSGLNGEHQVLRVESHYEKTYINYAKVIETDISASNGVIHAIQSVLLPPPDIFPGLLLFPTKFSTLTSAVQQVDVDRWLKKARAVTVFVPTNEAWKRLGCETLFYLFGPHGTDALKKVLNYHIVPDLTYSADLAPENGGRGRKTRKVELNTLEGSKIHLEIVQFGGRYLNIRINGGSKVVFSDAVAENGVVHMIDQVLLPQDLGLPQFTMDAERDECIFFE